MPNFNAPIELVGQPECEVLQLDCTETPYGSLDDHDVDISVEFVPVFQADGLEVNYYCNYTIPIRYFQCEEGVKDMFRTCFVPDSILISPSLASSVEEILSAARHVACHRPPSLTLLRLNVCLYLPVNRLLNHNEINDDYHNEDSIGFVPESDDDDEDAIGFVQAIDVARNSLDYLGVGGEDEGHENAIRFVPASEESIKGLEKVRVKNESGFDMECSVCLEELEVDSEATRLPCSHLFHGDCILKWLNTSRFCPLCRFELPS